MFYIFDMDGTLIDSMPSYGGAIIKFLEMNKITYPKDILKIVTPLGYAGAANYFIENLDCRFSVEEICNDFKQLMLDDYLYKIQAKSGVTKTLKALKSKSDSLSVLTASPHQTLDPCLKRLGIYDLFDKVWSCEDFGMTKADTEIYRQAAKILGTTVEECIFIDDNYNAVCTAKKAGMTAYGIYDDSSKEYVEDMKSISDKYLYTFEELLQ